jgi:cyclohexanecarboxylate-CoA ligase
MAGYMPLMLGATAVLQDSNTDMELLLDIMAEHRVSFLYSAPGYVVKLLAGNQSRRRDTSALRNFVSGSAPIQPQLIAAVKDEFGVPLHALWGMTENGSVTLTRPDDPPGWAAHSDGRPDPFMQVKIVPQAEDSADRGPALPLPDGGSTSGVPEPDRVVGRLLVRGSSQCLGYLGQKELYDGALDAGDFFDTGDLAYPDGRGGIRISGRRVDLITRASGQKVSTLEVEAVLMRHPAVTEAVLFGYPDPNVPGADLVCAIVIPDGVAPTLAELHAFLEAEKMARVLWPDRLQFARELPRTPLGKVRRNLLRERIEISLSRGQ